MTVPASGRIYSREEIAAGRKLKVTGQDGRGVLYYATGDWWTDHLDDMADEFDRQAQRARMLAAALRREQARW